MLAVSGTFLQALRLPHTAYVRVDAWRGGVRVASDLPVEGGSVTVSSGTGVRRMLNLTLAREAGQWELLAPVGTDLRPSRGIRYPNGLVESVQLGVFPIDVQKLGYAPGGQLALTAPDRYAAVQRGRFETPTKPNGPQEIRDEAARLMREPTGATSTVTATSTGGVHRVVWERDRAKTVEDLLKAIGAEGFFDTSGNVVVRDIPTLNGPTVWLVDASESGVLLDASRERNRQRTHNVVVVTDEKVDGQPVLATQVVADTDPSSPTRVSGPFGRVPFFLTSPLFTSTAQMRQAGQARLDRVRGLAAQLTIESTVNPALDAGDVISVLLPRERPDLPRPIERHLIDSVTVPLTADGAQSITTRSTRPDELTE